MNNIEILKEMYKEGINQLVKTDIYKITRKLQVLDQKENLLETLDLNDDKLIDLLPKTISDKIGDLKIEDQFSKYIGKWGNLNPREESDKLMDKEVYEIRNEKTAATDKINNKNNSEIREWYYIFVKVKRLEELLIKEGITPEVNDDGTVEWINKK